MFPVALVVFFNIFELSRRDASAKAPSGVCNFILIAKVVEVGWKELADGSPRRYDALDFFYFAQQFLSLFNNGNFLQKNCLDSTRLEIASQKNWKSTFCARHTRSYKRHHKKINCATTPIF